MSSENKFCRYCGKPIAPDTTVCPYCHKVLVDQQDPDYDGREETARESQTGYQQQKGSTNVYSADESEDEFQYRRGEQAAAAAGEQVKKIAMGVGGYVQKGVHKLQEAHDAEIADVPEDGFEEEDEFEGSRGSEADEFDTSNIPKRLGKYKLAENETIIRTYCCADLMTGWNIFNRKKDTKGYLMVSNKRLLYEGMSKTSRLAMEMPIQSVGRIYTFNGLDVRKGNIILSVILMFLSIIMFRVAHTINQEYRDFFDTSRGTGAGWLIFFGIVMLIIAALLIYFRHKRNYQLVIQSKDALGTAINVGKGPRTVQGNEALFTLIAKPTKQTYQMLYELGAIVQDVQNLGDKAIDKWKTV